MTIKTTGAEWKAFHNDNTYWGEFAMEEEDYLVNGAPPAGDPWDFDPSKLADDDKLEVKGGYVYDQGASEKELPLKKFFDTWKKQQTHEALVFSIPKDKVDAVKAAVAAALTEPSHA